MKMHGQKKKKNERKKERKKEIKKKKRPNTPCMLIYMYITCS